MALGLAARSQLEPRACGSPACPWRAAGCRGEVWRGWPGRGRRCWSALHLEHGDADVLRAARVLAVNHSAAPSSSTTWLPPRGAAASSSTSWKASSDEQGAAPGPWPASAAMAGASAWLSRPTRALGRCSRRSWCQQRVWPAIGAQQRADGPPPRATAFSQVAFDIYAASSTPGGNPLAEQIEQQPASSPAGRLLQQGRQGLGLGGVSGRGKDHLGLALRRLLAVVAGQGKVEGGRGDAAFQSKWGGPIPPRFDRGGSSSLAQYGGVLTVRAG